MIGLDRISNLLPLPSRIDARIPVIRSSAFPGLKIETGCTHRWYNNARSKI